MRSLIHWIDNFPAIAMRLSMSMKHSIRTIQKYHIAYSLLPFKRNQDVIKLLHGKGNLRYAVSVVDGWNWKERLDDDRTGRNVAQFIADIYPRKFQEHLKEKQYRLAAENAAKSVDQQVLAMYPTYVSAVAVFLLSFQMEDVVVYVGKGIVMIWDGRRWVKPKEIGNYFLDETKFGFPNEVSRFFGRGELKGDPFYSCKPDVVVCPAGTPIFLATDGIEDIFTQEEIKEFLKANRNALPQELIRRFRRECSLHGTQRDDISVLVRL